MAAKYAAATVFFIFQFDFGQLTLPMKTVALRTLGNIQLKL